MTIGNLAQICAKLKTQIVPLGARLLATDFGAPGVTGSSWWRGTGRVPLVCPCSALSARVLVGLGGGFDFLPAETQLCA